MKSTSIWSLLAASALTLTSCAVQVRQSFRVIGRDSLNARLSIPVSAGEWSDGSDTYNYIMPYETVTDTLTVIDPDGKKAFFMKTVADSSGAIHASEQLPGVVVTARFKNIPERNGMIRIAFDVNVPGEMLNPLWQLRLKPTALITDDTLELDEVRFTGKEYRERQIRGYELYDRFLASIITDSSELVHTGLLEAFIDRNIPALAALRNDSSALDPERVKGLYGITFRDAREHYLKHSAIARNNRRLGRLPDMYAKYVPDPLAHDGIRTDSVITGDGQDIIYRYSQNIRTKSGMRKIVLNIGGSIFYDGEEKYSLPPSPPLTFYISSFATLANNTERYITTVNDSVSITVKDTLYRTGLQAIMDRDFKKAILYLSPYRDLNCALAFLAMDYNASAMRILEELPVSGKRNYLMAIIHSRNGNERKAVEYFIHSVRLDPSLSFRGNLDPEISRLIEKYDIHSSM